MRQRPFGKLDMNNTFRQRCASALMHPATLAAVAVLLANDIVFKSLWPGTWFAGKLSDLAWMIFAPPLLAFLLSFAAGKHVALQRTAFLTAYAGLPLLYAAFNTFTPVHDGILRGISFVSGGTAGSPLDATDSIVIPLAMSIAVWVWRAPVLQFRQSAPAVGPARRRGCRTGERRHELPGFGPGHHGRSGPDETGPYTPRTILGTPTTTRAATEGSPGRGSTTPRAGGYRAARALRPLRVPTRSPTLASCCFGTTVGGRSSTLPPISGRKPTSGCRSMLRRTWTSGRLQQDRTASPTTSPPGT